MKNLPNFLVLCLAALLSACGGQQAPTSPLQLSNQPANQLLALVTVNDYDTVVQQLYIAYFGRPADMSGRANFKSRLAELNAPVTIQELESAYKSNPSIKELIDSFGTSAESAALYSGDTTAFVTSIYQNVLSRSPDAAGLAFWVEAIDKKALNRSLAAVSIMAGALSNPTTQGKTDGALIGIKVNASKALIDSIIEQGKDGYAGDAAAAEARRLLAGLTVNTTASSYASDAKLLASSFAARSGASAPNADGSWLTLTPNAVARISYQGESLAFVIDGKSSRTFSKVAYVGILDRTGVLTTELQVAMRSQYEFEFTLHTSPKLAPGLYKSSVEVRICEDNPLVCKNPFPGSPWTLLIEVTVRAPSNLTPLTLLPQAGPWSTYMGNATHSGYVPGSFDPAKFSTRLHNTNSPQRLSAPQPPAIEGGLIFVNDAPISLSNISNHRYLTAYSEASGDRVWSADLGAVLHVNAPATGNGKVYVATADMQNTYLTTFDQKTGAKLASLSRSEEPFTNNFLAPVVVGNDVYFGSAAAGWLRKLNGNELLWEAGVSTGRQLWTPAVDANYAYITDSGGMRAHRLSDGKEQFRINYTTTTSPAVTPVVVLSGKQYVFLNDGNNLVALDLDKRAQAWSYAGAGQFYLGRLAYANDVVYVINPKDGGTLEAHAAATGALLWSVPGLRGLSDEGGFRYVIVTDNLAFVSSDKTTLAIDLRTRAVVWKEPVGGDLAISDRGILYIGDSSFYRSAINLR